MTQAYPLAWPEGWKRTPWTGQKEGQFRKGSTNVSRGTTAKRIDMPEAVKRLFYELERLGVKYPRDDAVISTNLRLNASGLPRMDQGEPNDRGVAVYWKTPKGEPRVMAIDVYNRVADNIAAIAATLEAMRAIERHGGALVMDRAFSGFTALPAPTGKRPWWVVLGVNETASAEQIKAAWKAGVAKYHPDKPGGSHDLVAEINAARDAGLAARTIG